MFLIPSEDGQTFGMKPMNCPGHMLLFGSRLRSYRELPLRFAEAAALHRNELAGTLHGLLRVRHVTQDDAHIFCTPEQVEDEIFGCLDFGFFVYDLFQLDVRAELSTRPENRLGTDEQWDEAEAALARRSSGAGSSTRSTPATARSTGRRSTCTSRIPSVAAGSAAPSSSTSRCRPDSG